MGRLILTTAGTSLIHPNAERWRGIIPEAFSGAVKACDDNHDCTLDKVITGGNNALKDAEVNILRELNSLTLDRDWQRFPAEIASTSKLDPRPDQGDRIVVLHSDTIEGAFCARCVAFLMSDRLKVLRLERNRVQEDGILSNANQLSQQRADLRSKGILCQPFWSARVELLRIDKLKPDERGAQDFREQGCQNLAIALSSLFIERDTTAHRRVHLNMTGGLKSSIPFVTFVAMLWGIPLVYLYEESPDLLSFTVPRLKLAVDIENCLKAAPDNWPAINKVTGAKDYFAEGPEGTPQLTLLGRVVQRTLLIRDESKDESKAPLEAQDKSRGTSS